jgi:hypothetical protein
VLVLIQLQGTDRSRHPRPSLAEPVEQVATVNAHNRRESGERNVTAKIAAEIRCGVTLGGFPAPALAAP